MRDAGPWCARFPPAPKVHGLLSRGGASAGSRYVRLVSVLPGFFTKLSVPAVSRGNFTSVGSVRTHQLCSFVALIEGVLNIRSLFVFPKSLPIFRLLSAVFCWCCFLPLFSVYHLCFLPMYIFSVLFCAGEAALLTVSQVQCH